VPNGECVQVIRFTQHFDLFGFGRTEDIGREVVRIAFSAHANDLLPRPWREGIDNMLFDVREADRPEVSICQAEPQDVFYNIEKREDSVMDLGWKGEEGLWTGQADFSRVVMLYSCGFAGVLLGETGASSALCALEIAVFVVFGVFARLDTIDLFTNLYVRVL